MPLAVIIAVLFFSLFSIQPSAGSATGVPDSARNQETQSGPSPATIWDLYLSAKAKDPAIGRAEARVASSRAESDVLLSGLMPHLDGGAGVRQISQSLSNYPTTDANENYTAINYNITARLTLLHMPTIHSLSAAAANTRAEEAGVSAARQNLTVRLADAYFSLLKAQADKQIALGEISRFKQVLEQSQAFLKEGTGDIIAVYEAQSRLDGAAADLTKSECNLRLAEQKLSNVVGHTVTSIENYLPRQPKGPEPDDLDWWVATMEREQPVIRQAREGVAQASEQRKAAKSEHLPVLQAAGGYDVSRGTADYPSAEIRQWSVGASLTIPLYSGGETSAKVRRAIASEEERRRILDETRDLHLDTIKQAFFNLRYNISLIKALEQKKVSAEIQLAAVKKGRSIGTRNAIDLLNAAQAYSIALRDYKNALYDNFTSVVKLKYTAGILTDSDVAEISRAVAPSLGNSIR
jgi:outer membrane protein